MAPARHQGGHGRLAPHRVRRRGRRRCDSSCTPSGLACRAAWIRSVIVRVRPTHALPYLLAFVLGVGAAALTACGSTNKAMIPASNASKLKSDLDEVLNAID